MIDNHTFSPDLRLLIDSNKLFSLLLLLVISLKTSHRRGFFFIISLKVFLRSQAQVSIQIDFICHLLVDYCYQKIKVSDSFSSPLCLSTCISIINKQQKRRQTSGIIFDFIYSTRDRRA